MQLDEAIRRDDRIVEFAALVEGVDLHQLAFRRPDRIGMLAFHLIEVFGRGDVVFLAQGVHRLVVEIVDRLFDVSLVLCVATAGGKRQQQRDDREPQRRKQPTHRQTPTANPAALIARIVEAQKSAA